MLQVLDPGDLAIDAGAHKGAYTCWMRKAVGKTGEVIAFEPQPELSEKLKTTAQEFGWQNVQVENAGLSSFNGKLDLHVPGSAPSPSASFTSPDSAEDAKRIKVPVYTLDNYMEAKQMEEPVTFIKCDVEGHELEVFRGARRTLQLDRPVVLFESEVRHHPGQPIRRIFSYLNQLNYHGYFFWKRHVKPISEFHSTLHQDISKKAYANNFLFLPEGLNV